MITLPLIQRVQHNGREFVVHYKDEYPCLVVDAETDATANLSPSTFRAVIDIAREAQELFYALRAQEEAECCAVRAKHFPATARYWQERSAYWYRQARVCLGIE